MAMEWNWSNLPETEHAALISHVEAQQWQQVARICEQYKVSTYCCCNVQGLQAWALWAIETGIINDERTVKNMASHNG